jgi:hypothetical protein
VKERERREERVEADCKVEERREERGETGCKLTADLCTRINEICERY